MRVIVVLRSLCILLFLFSCLINATQFDDPYQGYIVVENQNEAQLKSLALKQVLIKVSGNKEITALSDSNSLFQNINTMLSQYGYVNLGSTRYFTAVFDKHKINQALTDMQQSIWGDTRPITLVWLISDGQGERKLVSDNVITSASDNVLSQTLQNEQLNRGIKLQFPLMDLDDNLAISVSDVSGRFYGQIASASMRYNTNHFVVAQWQEDSTSMGTLTWQLVTYNEQNKQSRVLINEESRGSKESLITAMIDKVADYYAGQYAISINPDGELSQTITVNGITSLAQLTELTALLGNLLSVSSYSIAHVDVSTVTIDIQVNGGLDSFKNGLLAQPHLQAELSDSNEFNFNWR
ncbi:DUF2066 domain-containing protein [Psychromonas sp. MME2]|uniref:DUF2066 domain-containing protein n=1 Tax=unclassified Psychromonas TaxID=2614957 RepID=UPI00339B9E95